MPTQIALLRGVNVGGNPIKMEVLYDICTTLGLAAVRTYAQSGNVVFEAPGTRWRAALEQLLAEIMRLPVTVIPRTAAEMDSVVAGNPFAKQHGRDPAKLHVTFLARQPDTSAAAGLNALDTRGDAFALVGQHICLHCPNGYGRTALKHNAGKGARPAGDDAQLEHRDRAPSHGVAQTPLKSFGFHRVACLSSRAAQDRPRRLTRARSD
jgi:uncharacterized protein (DUF1697 family)